MKSLYFRKGRPCTHKGFTLIELLIVIAIITILSGIIISSLTGSKAKSRDAARVSDIAQIQLAIEQYFDRCQKYPTGLDVNADYGCKDFNGNTIKLGAYISQVPNDPSTGQSYGYAINSGPTDYVLHAGLETNAAALSDSLTNSSAPAWFQAFNPRPFACYSGGLNGSLYDYCIGSK